jgi:starch phosphorylase
MKHNERHFPYMPERLTRLQDLAYDLWFSWHAKAVHLFKTLDVHLWENVGRNPIRMLREIAARRLDELARDPEYLEIYDQIVEAYDHYLADAETWYNDKHGGKLEGPVAYFSMEFGLHESLPIYSGGLGILAGDHLKSASDLGIPMVAIGLLYRESYFTQQISLNGHQQSQYNYNDFSNLPVNAVLDEDNEPLTIRVPIDDRTIAMRVWQANVGRVPLYLLDTDFPENPAEDRKITERLYVSDRETRLLQEVLLGIGGVHVLQALDIEPAVWHMNEGHCSFLTIERQRQLIKSGCSLQDAFEKVKSTTVFTTHTPVAAGNEVFETFRIEPLFQPFWEAFGISKEEFLKLAQEVRQPDPNAFNMTILSLRHSRKANAVSQLHGFVSRNMWHGLYPDRSLEDVPIGAITNGIHTRTWMAGLIKNLLDKHLGEEWRYHIPDPEFWKGIDRIPDAEIWQTHLKLKTALFEEVRCRVTGQRERNGESDEAVSQAKTLLNPDWLTIGFARRFAQYKRGRLIFRDRGRILYLINQADKPVQFIFAGKAHPADQGGKALIKEIYDESRNPEFQSRIVFVENYDITLARHLVTGVDVWLNTPRRPFEASGTSGMKVAANGGINLSILDGWWREAYDGTNGWAIGEDREYYNEWEQDEADSQSLYNLLEHVIIPLYYKKDKNNISPEWIERMKASMKTIIPMFNTHRMLQEYMEQMYLTEE